MSPILHLPTAELASSERIIFDPLEKSPKAVSMNILMLTNHIVPDKLGGLGRYVIELSRTLQRRGHQVTVVTKQYRSDDPLFEIDPSGIVISRYEASARLSPAFLVKYPWSVATGVGRRLKVMQTREMVVHGHYAFPMLNTDIHRSHGYLYTFHAPVHRELISENGHATWFPRPLHQPAVRTVRALEARVLNRATNVVTLSEFMRDEATRLSPRATNRIHVVPGGIDLNRFSPGKPTSPGPVSAEGSPKLFAARRLVQRTGVEELVRAMPSVVSEYPAARLFIAGVGSMEEHIRALISTLGVEENVTMLGRVSEEELIDWYRVADVAITPTRELEGFGLSTAEAMACGTSPLVTPAGANPELVRELGPEHITLGTSPTDLVAGILRLMRAKHRGRDDGARLTAITQRWAWDQVAQQYEELYRIQLEHDTAASRHDH